LQYERQKPKFPWGGILLAIFLLVAGTVLIVFSCLLFTGHISGSHADGAWPCMILGMLMFIPGIYHVRIAWLAFRGYPGYVYEDIPNFE
ncbi:transmembrane protein 230, partial [Parasteatoda tepidariorum]